ncbi:MAG: outer membrane beta-barrel protein [Prevotellaceae bacterium]|nr:outer membrane beta-barrel protein [Prevotellaceae bacterium]MDY6131527.1 outer membrane beta-barrel protein [Prevotella sp.]
MRIFFALFMACCLVFPTASHAQQKEGKKKDIFFQGQVQDAFTRLDIDSVKIQLMTADSMVIDSCFSRAWNERAVHPSAYFEISKKLQEGKYIFKATHPDYNDSYHDFDLKLRGRKMYYQISDFTMKRKKMDEKTYELGEVVVKSTKIKMIMKGDTIVYNADAFNIAEGSMLEALIRQLPGATMNSNGEIFINGRKLDYLLLNGKDFFKGDNKTMMDNLPFYTVKNLQVYEKEKETDGMPKEARENKDYVMDVKLKKEYEKNMIANVDLAMGSNKRYATKMFGLYFTPRLQFSVFANMNNVNEDRKPGEKGDWNPRKLPNGQLAQKTVGINLAVDNEKRTLMDSFSGSVSWRDSENDSKTATESFLPTGNTFGRSSSNNDSKNFVVGAENKLDIEKSYKFRNFTTLTYRKFDNIGINRSATFNADPSSFGSTQDILDTMFAAPLSPKMKKIGVNRHYSRMEGTGHNLSLYSMLGYRKEFKSGDFLNLNADVQYNNSKNSLFNKYQLNYLQGTAADDCRNRYDDTPSYSYNYNANVSYIFRFAESFGIRSSLSYKQKGKFDTVSKYRLDRLDGWGDGLHPFGSLPSTRDSMLLALDANNSYQGNYLGRICQGELDFMYGKRVDDKGFDAFLMLPFHHIDERLDYRSRHLSTLVKNRGWRFEPEFQVTLYKGETSLFMLHQMSVSSPDLYSMIDRRDDSNPLAVALGNPHLKNQIVHNFRLYFHDGGSKRVHLPYINAEMTVMRNSVANGFVYAPETGVYTFKPENVNGNWQVSLYSGMEFPLDSAKHFTMNIGVDYQYNHNVDLTAVAGSNASILSKVNNHLLTQDLSLSYELDKFRCSIDGEITWRSASSTRENFQNINAFDFNYGVTGSCRFAFGMETGMDLKMFSRWGYADRSMNTNDWVCNAYISKSFLKGKFITKVEAFDLFHQLSSVSYTVNGQGKTETRFNTIPHYVMLHAMYKINIGGKKQ